MTGGGIDVALVGNGGVLLAGLGTLLADGGFQTAQVAWSECTHALPIEARAAVVVVNNADSLRSTELLAARTMTPILAIVEAPEHEMLAELLRVGCSGAVDGTVTADALSRAVQLVAAGFGVTTRSTLACISAHVAADRTVTDEERRWLQSLSEGQTIATIARESGYGERSMYRLLSGLYHRLGASGRYEAIAEARRRGILEDSADAGAQ